jgi:hypothetical protein
MSPNAHPQGWQGLLAEGEGILWQGRPRAGVIWTNALSMQAVMGIFFAGFAIVWINMTGSITSGGNFPGPARLFPLFGLIFLAIGLYQAVGHLFWDAYMRSQTHYTLTNRNAIIARNVRAKRTLQTWAIRSMPDITLEDGSPGAVYFATKTRTVRHYSRPGTIHIGSRASTIETRIGFRQIDDARDVYSRLQTAKRQLEEPSG